jgi:hypothetical protein
VIDLKIGNTWNTYSIGETKMDIDYFILLKSNLERKIDQEGCGREHINITHHHLFIKPTSQWITNGLNDLCARTLSSNEDSVKSRYSAQDILTRRTIRQFHKPIGLES